MRFPHDQFDQEWYIAQGFGAKTTYGYHEGADANLKTGGDTDLGKPIYAISDGVVTSVHNHTTKPTFGNHIHIQHDGPWGTIWCHFAHCQSIVVKEGDKIKEGQLVAYVGKSGTDFAHNHWAIKLAPTGIDGIAKTLDDLNKWTDPVAFVRRWMNMPTNNDTSDRRPYWFDLINKVVWDKPREEITDEMVSQFTKEYPSQRERSGRWDQLVVGKLNLSDDSNQVSVEDVLRVLSGYKSRVTDLQNQLSECQANVVNKDSKISNLEDTLLNREKLIIELQGKEKPYLDRIKFLEGERDRIEGEKRVLNMELKKCQAGQSSCLELLLLRIKKLFNN